MSKREEAIAWWRSLNIGEKRMHMSVRFQSRRPSSLTGREIESLYNEKVESDTYFINMVFGDDEKK